MTWINLDIIDTVSFRQGYVPPGYHDLIVYSRDGRFMYPKVIMPLSFNFQKKRDLIHFFDAYRDRFNMSGTIEDAVLHAFMPEPGEVRPTHFVFRIDVSTCHAGEPGDATGDHHPRAGHEVREQVVMKIVNNKFGYQEYRKQQKLHELGFPTPEPFYYCNYFTEIQDVIKEEMLEVEIPGAATFMDFLRDIERDRRPFTDLKQPAWNERGKALVAAVADRVASGPGTSNPHAPMQLSRFLDDLDTVKEGIFDGLEFKGFLFMDYIRESLSFEMILFDILGGKHLEKVSGAMDILPFRPFFNAENIITNLVDLIVELWELGEVHNDLKGEHLLYSWRTREWNVIDWGELVGGSRGKDLAVLLADSNAFIHDRIKFNKMLGRRVDADQAVLEAMGGSILRRNEEFWAAFLSRLAGRVDREVFEEAHELLGKRQLSFNMHMLERYL